MKRWKAVLTNVIIVLILGIRYPLVDLIKATPRQSQIFSSGEVDCKMLIISDYLKKAAKHAYLSFWTLSYADASNCSN